MSARRRRASGQAMAEFAVAVGVLALLLAGLPALQRYHQLQFAAVGAARESAWLGSWRDIGAPAAAVAPGLVPGLAQLRSRWLPGGDADAGAGGGGGGAHGEADARELRIGLSRPGLPGAAGAGTRALLLPLRPLAALGGSASSGGLRAGGLVQATVSLEVATPAELPEPFGGLGLTLREQHVLAADGWGAAGPAQVVARVQPLVPSSLLARVPGLASVGTALLSLIEPQFRHFCPGLVDPEIVPADRLGRGSADEPPTDWRPRC